jgi:hypothetical protein
MALLGATLAVVAGWDGRRAWADQDATERLVVLTVAGCPAGADSAIRRIVELEIGDLLAKADENSETDRLAVVCTDQWARLQASGPDRPLPVDRTLRLGDFPADAVPRALALAGIEMLAALSPAVRRRVEAGAVKEEAPAPQPLPPATWHADASWSWHDFLGDKGLSLWGGRARMGRDLGEHLSLGLDLEAAHGSRTVALGQVNGTLGAAGAFFGIHAGARDLFAEIALGGRMGFAQLSGDPSDAKVTGNRVSRAWGGPALALRFWTGVGRVALVFSGESGLALLGAEGLAGETTAVQVRRLWVSLGLGVGLRL